MFLTGFVYPTIVHSIWSSNGFLSAFQKDPIGGIGVVDFAGSGVIHVTGGLTALIATSILGPRRGRFYADDGKALENPAPIKGHSMALQLLGTLILWFGCKLASVGFVLSTMVISVLTTFCFFDLQGMDSMVGQPCS